MRIIFVIVALLGAALLGGGVAAHDIHKEAIHAAHAWARATTSLAKTGAAYLTIMNLGDRPDRLVTVASPIAERVEIHAHSMKGEVMSMRRVEAVEVHPGAPTVFKPGGMHVMLIGLKRPLRQGDRFPLTLTLETLGPIHVEVVVQGAGSMGPGHGHDERHSNPGSMHKMN